jgi:2-dehydropantoate 2-reductase
MRIGVLGAGGMGSAFAAHLARAGRDVVLIGRGSTHVRALAAGPLRVEPPEGEPWTAAVPVAETAAAVPAGSLDALLVLTKTYDLAEATRAAAHVLTPDGVAVPLQNGLGTDVPVAAAFGGNRTLVGTTTVGAALQEPGRITVTGSTAAGESWTDLGRMGRGTAPAERGDRVAELLTGAGLPTAATPRVEELVWRKLALAVMSPVSTVPRVTVGAVWGNFAGRAVAERMFEEVLAVAAASGVRLDADGARAHCRRTWAGTGEHYTSMCRDVREGRRTELADLTGAVVRRAAVHGVPVPTHETVLALLDLAGVR